MSSDEFGLANFAQQAFRSNPQVLVFGHEQTELAGQVPIRFIVRRCRKEDALAVVFPGCIPEWPGIACPHDFSDCGFRR